jgi:D-inositol-3-phosphate glycosyltransferase
MPRRIAVICYHSSPLDEPGVGDAGGMTVYVRGIARAMSERQVRTDIFTRASSSDARITEIYPGVRVIPISAGPRHAIAKEEGVRYVEDFVSGVRAFALGQRAAYDVVHSHYWQSGLVAKDLAAAWGIPMVHSHHSLGRVKNGSLAPGDRPEPPLRLAGEEETISAADVLVVSTDDEWQQLACLYGAEHDRLKTIHPGVDHEIFHPDGREQARRALGFADQAVMLYVGRIQALKGLDLAVEALAHLSHKLDREIVFIVAGGGSGAGGDAEVDRLAKLAAGCGVQHLVRFVGPQPHRALPIYYRAADVLVVCSHSESFGLSALEAHACGTPVVGTAVGGLSHIVQDGRSGFLVGTRDAEVFAERLQAVLHTHPVDPDFRAAAVRSAQRFSWKRASVALIELYECLIEEQLPAACTC